MKKRSLGEGRYTLIERLGEGATKEVFLARDETLQRDVALCTFKPYMLSDGYIDRVQREVRTLAGLPHPNPLPGPTRQYALTTVVYRD